MPDTEALNVITIARGLIADPAKWCQNVSAQMASGERTYPLDSKACRWCAGGAMELAALGDDKLLARAIAIVDAVVRAEHGDERWTLQLGNEEVPKKFERLWHVNDKLGHLPVLRILDLATA